ncbi:MAG: DUF2007 domain-containing protein [Rhizobiales bacterium]|nr:DUF2007 domain-containing protein [Hyphomicrobiales bacterium]
MKQVAATNDPVLLSALKHALEAEGIEVFEFDSYTSAVEGSIGAIPRRLMVVDEDHDRAMRVHRNLVLTNNG